MEHKTSTSTSKVWLLSDFVTRWHPLRTAAVQRSKAETVETRLSMHFYIYCTTGEIHWKKHSTLFVLKKSEHKSASTIKVERSLSTWEIESGVGWKYVRKSGIRWSIRERVSLPQSFGDDHLHPKHTKAGHMLRLPLNPHSALQVSKTEWIKSQPSKPKELYLETTLWCEYIIHSAFYPCMPCVHSADLTVNTVPQIPSVMYFNNRHTVHNIISHLEID